MYPPHHNGVRDETQIHTHMCHSEFNDIIASIAEMDADVITIETLRFDMELLDAFDQFRYPNEIGPAVYDIHYDRDCMLRNHGAAHFPSDFRRAAVAFSADVLPARTRERGGPRLTRAPTNGRFFTFCADAAVAA